MMDEEMLLDEYEDTEGRVLDDCPRPGVGQCCEWCIETGECPYIDED